MPLTTPMPEGLADRYPSLRWGEREWVAVLRADDDVFYRLLGGIGKQKARQERQPARPILTVTTLRAIRLYGEGYTRRQIADFMHLSEKTVRAYLRRAYEQLGDDLSPAELLLRCRSLGFTMPESFPGSSE